MEDTSVLNYIKDVIDNVPLDWLELTTHRLDIYVEELAKVQFIDQFEALYKDNNSATEALMALPTAFDYIRLGHPLSCVLEWGIAKINNVTPERVISFSSRMAPVLAILRKNLFDNRPTQILYTDALPDFFDTEVLRRVYGYTFDLVHIDANKVIDARQKNVTTIFISENAELSKFDLSSDVDFYINWNTQLGSVVLINGSEDYISEIQHVRRRETIAMTPDDTLVALNRLTGQSNAINVHDHLEANRTLVTDSIKKITGVDTKVLVGSSGLSIQYAIVMGLIDEALEKYKGKAIKIVVPPNCYGGTNDQARRVAACIDNVDIVDLPVDAGNDMVRSIDTVLDQIAADDAVPFIIAEIPTNPRVEVPDLIGLKKALRKSRKTSHGTIAIDPVFILDQTFCPNVQFLGEGEILSTVRAIAYISGSKFPSGGKCNAGFCVANKVSESLMDKVERHLIICDNEATNYQIEILANQMPSMNQRIHDAYINTRAFVNFIEATLPAAKINFVSEELADQGFTPSVFSFDLPTNGTDQEDKESYKRDLNLKLINLMINEIPEESKFCVSYGQLKGCYWTVPATSTQGTTKEGDKDYIVRVSVSPDLDLERHKAVFAEFVERYGVA